MSEPRYPDVHVQLTGTDGNAYAIMGGGHPRAPSGGCVRRGDQQVPRGVDVR